MLHSKGGSPSSTRSAAMFGNSVFHSRLQLDALIPASVEADMARPKTQSAKNTL